MTLYISDTECRNSEAMACGQPAAAGLLKTGMKYFAASILTAAAAAVYGLFSHGVYSYFMTYAFMIPLLLGAAPYLTAAMSGKDLFRGVPLGGLQLAAVATLTVGSLLKGALDIYGTTNRLVIFYPAAAVMILTAALAMTVKYKRKQK